MKVMTSQWNIRFFEASSAAGALAIIQKENIDIVLTDIELPDMDAYSLISAVRQLDLSLSTVPFIATISNDSGPAENPQSKSYFTGFISKPFTEAELMRQIINALNADGE